jgi:hypothetical protein
VPTLLFAFVVSSASQASAQEPRVEITGFGGYTFSEGVKVDPGRLISAIIEEVNPTSGASFGAGLSVFLTDYAQVGFQWSQQDSNLEVKGTTIREIASLTLNSYHGTFTYNLGEPDALVLPFIFGGAGATQFDPGDVMGLAIEGNTRFSTIWGGGVKVFPTPRVGFSLTGRWTPTYIKSDTTGELYCSPYWSPYYPSGCVAIPDPDYSNQFEITGGVNLRF